MLFSVARYKGSTGAVNLSWAVTIGPNTPPSFTVSPLFGQLKFIESQWNSSIHLQLHSIPKIDQQIEISVTLLNITGGGMLGNVTTLKVVFLSNNDSDELGPEVKDDKAANPAEDNDSSKTDVFLTIILLCVSGAVLIVGIAATTIFLRRRSRKRYSCNFQC